MGQVSLVHDETWCLAHVLADINWTEFVDEDREALVHELYELLRPHLTRLLVKYHHELHRVGRLRNPPIDHENKEQS